MGPLVTLSAAAVVGTLLLQAVAVVRAPRRRLAQVTFVGAVLVVFLAAWLGPMRWARIAAAEPQGPGGKAPQPGPVDTERLLQRELSQREQRRHGPPAIGLEEVTTLGRLTGHQGLNATAARWNVHGTDLGHPLVHDGRLHLVFGDTFGRGGFGGQDWRSNAMAVAKLPPSSSLPFAGMMTDRPRHAKELLGSRKIDGLEKTVIPTYGISVGGSIILHYMSVKTWQGPGRWLVNESGLAVSDDGGRTWTKDTGVRWAGDGNFAQAAFVPHDGLLYVFGIPAGRFGAAHLARVPPGDVLEQDAYRYWDGQGWVRDVRAAAPVVPAPVSELSVAWSSADGVWMMLYLDQPRQGVVLRTARRLNGPWSDPELVISAADQPTLYSPYFLPGSVTDDEVMFTLSRYDLYNVLLMKATITRR